MAALMRVSRMTVYRMVRSGQIPAVQFGKSYRIPEPALDAYFGPLSAAARETA